MSQPLVDPSRAGVDAVLDQLLDDRTRTLDHLSGRDLVGDDRVKQFDQRRLCSDRTRSLHVALPKDDSNRAMLAQRLDHVSPGFRLKRG